MKLRNLTAIALIAFHALALYGMSAEVTLGNTKIAIPIPDGFSQLDGMAQKIDVPGGDSIQMHFRYIKPKDSNTFYFYECHSIGSYANKNFSESDFQAIAGMFKLSIGHFMKEAQSLVQKTRGLETVFLEKPILISEGLDYLLATTPSKEIIDGRSVFYNQASLMMNIKLKVLTLVYGVISEGSFNGSQQDVINAAESWRNAIIAANQ